MGSRYLPYSRICDQPFENFNLSSPHFITLSFAFVGRDRLPNRTALKLVLFFRGLSLNQFSYISPCVQPSNSIAGSPTANTNLSDHVNFDRLGLHRKGVDTEPSRIIQKFQSYIFSFSRLIFRGVEKFPYFIRNFQVARLDMTASSKA